jgi:hypothetical protein
MESAGLLAHNKKEEEKTLNCYTVMFHELFPKKISPGCRMAMLLWLYEISSQSVHALKSLKFSNFQKGYLCSSSSSTSSTSTSSDS